MKKCCERLGVSYAKAYGWSNKGHSADEAVKMALEYKSIRKLCKENGICYDSVVHRHVKTGEDYYKIVKHFVLKRGGVIYGDNCSITGTDTAVKGQSKESRSGLRSVHY